MHTVRSLAKWQKCQTSMTFGFFKRRCIWLREDLWVSQLLTEEKHLAKWQKCKTSMTFRFFKRRCIWLREDLWVSELLTEEKHLAKWQKCQTSMTFCFFKRRCIWLCEDLWVSELLTEEKHLAKWQKCQTSMTFRFFQRRCIWLREDLWVSELLTKEKHAKHEQVFLILNVQDHSHNPVFVSDSCSHQFSPCLHETASTLLKLWPQTYQFKLRDHWQWHSLWQSKRLSTTLRRKTPSSKFVFQRQTWHVLCLTGKSSLEYRTGHNGLHTSELPLYVTSCSLLRCKSVHRNRGLLEVSAVEHGR